MGEAHGNLSDRRTWRWGGRRVLMPVLVAGAMVVGSVSTAGFAAAAQPPHVSNCTGSASPVRRWVTFLYTRALFRCDTGADSEFGIKHFEPALVRGNFSRSVYRSTEGSRKWVAQAYELFRQRSADPSGSAFWTGRVHTGTRYDAFESTLIGSNEYFAKAGSTNDNFVEAVYEDLLDRPAHSSERAYWVHRLATGSSRGGVALVIDRSPQRRRIIADLWGYSYVLHRAPSAAEKQYWAGKQAGGMDQLDLSAAFTASDEGVSDASSPGF